jgi:hypothetical protein
MLVEADMEIVMALCEVCPAPDTTGVAEILLVCFESRLKVVPLLRAVIQKEISLTGTDNYKTKKFHRHNKLIIFNLLYKVKKEPYSEVRPWQHVFYLFLQKIHVLIMCVSHYNPLLKKLMD